MRVRRDDGVRGLFTALGIELGHGLLDAGLDLVHRQRHADHSRRADDDVQRIAAECRSRDFLRLLRVSITDRARAGIGASGIRNDGMCRARCDDFFRCKDRGRRDLVLRERAGNDSLRLRIDDGEVRIAALLDAGLHASSGKALRERDAKLGIFFREHMGNLL